MPTASPIRSNGWRTTPCGASCGTKPWPIAGRPGVGRPRARRTVRPWRILSRRWRRWHISPSATRRWHRPLICGFDLRNALLPLDEQARLFDHLRAAEPLAERLGDPQRLGRIVSFLCFSFSVMGEHDRAIAAGQRALALATTSGAFDVQVNAQNNLSVAYYAAGDYRQALDVSQRMIAVLTGELLSERFGLPIFPGLLGRGYVAWCLAELGDFAEGAGIGEEAVRLAEAVAQPNSMVVVLYCVGLFYRRQGVLQKAIPMLERGLALCPERRHTAAIPPDSLPLECGVCPGRARGGGPAAPGPDAGAPGHRQAHAPPCAGAHRAERGVSARRPRG